MELNDIRSELYVSWTGVRYLYEDLSAILMPIDLAVLDNKLMVEGTFDKFANDSYHIIKNNIQTNIYDKSVHASRLLRFIDKHPNWHDPVSLVWSHLIFNESTLLFSETVAIEVTNDNLNKWLHSLLAILVKVLVDNRSLINERLHAIQELIITTTVIQ